MPRPSACWRAQFVGRSGGRFLLRGDNKTSRDPWQPRPADVVGELVVRVPRLGLLIAEVRSAAGLAAAAALVTFFVALGGSPPPRRREEEPPAPDPYGSRAQSAALLADASRALAAGLVVLAVRPRR